MHLIIFELTFLFKNLIKCMPLDLGSEFEVLLIFKTYVVSTKEDEC